MFERFVDRSRRAVVLAQEQARLLGHETIGTEHLLLGLLTEDGGVAAQVLDGLDVRAGVVKDRVLIHRPPTRAPDSHMAFTPRLKKVFELALREALQLGHSYIGTEHLLLALVREGEGIAATVLIEDMHLSLAEVRRAVIEQLSEYHGGTKREPDPPAGPHVLSFTVTGMDPDHLPIVGQDFTMPVYGGQDWFDLGTVTSVGLVADDTFEIHVRLFATAGAVNLTRP